MNAARKPIPKATREAVLQEFSHRCAVCGKDRPQIHHVDNDHTNNSLENLLPLCPNHHLIDQHDPTRKRDAELLSIFRKHKDPQILSPRFDPVYRRVKPLLHPSPEASFDQLSAAAIDLASFISRFRMGEYYFGRLEQLLDWHGPSGFTFETAQAAYSQHRAQYVDRLRNNVPTVLALLVEQIRYQDWPPYEA